MTCSPFLQYKCYVNDMFTVSAIQLRLKFSLSHSSYHETFKYLKYIKSVSVSSRATSTPAATNNTKKRK